MPFYKDTDNKIHFLDSSDFVHLLPTGYFEITDTEAHSIIQSTQPKQINVSQFMIDIKSALGGIIGYNNLVMSYPLLSIAIQSGDWFDVQLLLIDAKTKLTITTQQYSEIFLSAIVNNIPIILE